MPRSRPAAKSSVVHVSGYTRQDGTEVAPHTRAYPGRGTGTSGPGAQNPSDWRSDHLADMERALPRADIKQTPTHDGDTRKRTHYVDNAHNRRLGRVGLAIPSSAGVQRSTSSGQPSKTEQYERIRNTLAEKTGQEILAMYQESIAPLEANRMSLAQYNTIQQVAYRQQRAEAEEAWDEEGLGQQTDLTRTSAASRCGDPRIHLDEIKMEKAIGRGGFGEVFAARYKGTAVAVKRLHLQTWSARRLDTFKTELQVLSAVEHPNVVKVLGIILESPQFGIVMEYAPRSLFTALFIDEAPFSGSAQKTIMLEVCSALEHLHSKGIAHCDLKVENVLLDATNHAKICDFGLSFIQSQTDVSTSRSQAATAAPGQGTPRYSAPEVLRGERLALQALLQTDVYSLALVTYELVVREEVFIDYTLRQLEKSVGEGSDRPAMPAGGQLLDFVRQMWAKDPTSRPSLKRVVQHFTDTSERLFAPLARAK